MRMSTELKLIESPFPSIQIPDVSVHKLLLQAIDKHSDQLIVICFNCEFKL